MRTSFFSGIALSVSLIAGGLALAPAFAQTTTKFTTHRESTQGMTIPQVQKKLAALGYQNIDSIKRDRDAFEVKASDKNGARIKLHVDAQTGEIIDKRMAVRGRDHHEQRSLDEGKRNSADCTKRRCRDDQPQQNAAAPLTGK